MKCRYLLIFIIIFSTWLDAGADSVIKVKAIGRASPNIRPASKARAAAFRAAKVEGYKKLAEAAGFFKISQPGKNKHIKVDTFLKGARVVNKRYISDYKVEVVMEIPLPQLVNQLAEIKKRDFYHSQISQLKREIKSIEAQMSTLNSRFEKLKKMVDALEEKVKNQDR